MSALDSSSPATDPTGAPTNSQGASPSRPSSNSPVPSTRVGAAWTAICTATLMLVVLIVFMLQNTRKVEVTFLWMHGSVPLALALLIAGVGVGIATAAIGTARITQLRRLSRRR
jgi:putative membrane protein